MMAPATSTMSPGATTDSEVSPVPPARPTRRTTKSRRLGGSVNIRGAVSSHAGLGPPVNVRITEAPSMSLTSLTPS